MALSLTKVPSIWQNKLAKIDVAIMDLVNSILIIQEKKNKHIWSNLSKFKIATLFEMCRAHTTNPFFVKHLMIVHLAITNYNLGRKKV